MAREPLAGDESEALAGAAVDVALPADVMAGITARSGGNPLFVIELARLAARNEQLPDDEASLVAAGLLPSDWMSRVDGGRLRKNGDGVWVDSLRGARGVLRPIPDTPLSQVSQHERREYEQAAVYYQQKLRTMDPLMVAVKNGRSAMALYLVTQGADVRFKRYRDGQSALQLSVSEGNANLTTLLLEHGADPNTASDRGYTPLHAAVLRCDLPTALALLGHGADPDRANDQGETPRDSAARCNADFREQFG